MEQRQLFAKSELAKFFYVNSGINISDIDDIVVDYMISIIEDIGSNPHDAETDFDVDQFSEMIASSIDGFDKIESITVCDWLFDLARRIEDGSYLKTPIEFPIINPQPEPANSDLVEPPNEDEDHEDNTRHTSPTTISVDIPNSLKWLYSDDISATELFNEQVEQQSLSRIDNMINSLNIDSNNLFDNRTSDAHDNFLDTVTENNNRNSSYMRTNNDPYSLFREDSPPLQLFENDEFVYSDHSDDSPYGSQYFDKTRDGSENVGNAGVDPPLEGSDAYTTIRNESPPFEEDNQDVTAKKTKEPLPLFKIEYKTSSIKLSSKEKIEKMKELFPLIPDQQLRRCLNRFKGNLNKAIQYLVGQQTKKEDKSDDDDDNEDTDEAASLQVLVDSRTEAAILQLQDIFPNTKKSLIRDCILTVGNDIERATQMLLSEDLSSVVKNDKFQIHQESSKRRGLSEEEKNKMKKSVVQKYGYVEVKLHESNDKQKKKKSNVARNNSIKNSPTHKRKDINTEDSTNDIKITGEEKPTASTSKTHRKKRSR